MRASESKIRFDFLFINIFFFFLVCPLHWTYYDGHCYRFFSDRVNYASADKTCQDNDAVLVSPNGLQEFRFMLSLT